MARRTKGLDQGEAAEAFAAIIAAEQAAEEAVAARTSASEGRLAAAREAAAALRARIRTRSERWAIAQRKRTADHANAIAAQIAALSVTQTETAILREARLTAARVADDLLGDED